MDNPRFVSFASSEREIISLLIALRSLKTLKIATAKPLVLIPKPVIDEFEARYPDLPLRGIIQGLRAKLVTPFPNGYNEKSGFRNVLRNIERRIGNNGMIYFAPTIVFRNPDLEKLTAAPLTFARADDEFWPTLSLYDPTLDEFWSELASFAGVELNAWIDNDHPANYWRHYPAFSERLFYVQDVASFVQEFDDVSEQLQTETPRFLEGMNPDHAQAAMAIVALRQNASIVDVGWGTNYFGYIDVYDLVLRLDNERYEWLAGNVIRTNDLRGIMKTINEYKVVFFQRRLVRIREDFDEVEQNFSMNRMQTLIANRKIRQRMRQAARKLVEASEA